MAMRPVETKHLVSCHQTIDGLIDRRMDKKCGQKINLPIKMRIKWVVCESERQFAKPDLSSPPPALVLLPSSSPSISLTIPHPQPGQILDLGIDHEAETTSKRIGERRTREKVPPPHPVLLFRKSHIPLVFDLSWEMSLDKLESAPNTGPF